MPPTRRGQNRNPEAEALEVRDAVGLGGREETAEMPRTDLLDQGRLPRELVDETCGAEAGGRGQAARVWPDGHHLDSHMAPRQDLRDLEQEGQALPLPVLADEPEAQGSDFVRYRRRARGLLDPLLEEVRTGCDDVHLARRNAIVPDDRAGGVGREADDASRTLVGRSLMLQGVPHHRLRHPGCGTVVEEDLAQRGVDVVADRYGIRALGREQGEVAHDLGFAIHRVLSIEATEKSARILKAAVATAVDQPARIPREPMPPQA